MDPFTAAIGPLLTAVAGSVLTWVLIRGKDAANRTRQAGAESSSRREKIYRHSFESSPVGLAVLTPQGQWVRVNDRMRTLLGYSRSELTALTIRELTHSDDRKLEASYIRKLMRREIGSYSLQKRLLCKDRTYRRFDVSMVRFEDEGGTQDLWQCVVNPLVNSVQDEPVEHADNLGRILEPITDVAYFTYDDQGIIQEWNDGAARIYGHAREEIVGRSRTSLYRDADVWEQRPLKDMKEAIAKGRLEYDDTRVGRDGVEIRLKVTIIPDVRDERVAGFMELAREIDQARGVDQYRQAYERLKDISEEKIHSLQREITDLRQEVDELRDSEKTASENLRRAREEGQKQMGELRILTDAFRKELENRRSLEHELTEALEERDQLGHRMIELEKRKPLLETEFVELATPSEAHWISVENGLPAEIMRELAEEQRTGTLVAAAHSVEKRIFFDHGQVYSSTSNDPSMFLGEVLLRDGAITPEEHERALEIHLETGIALGRILVLNGTLDEEALTAAMATKTKSEVADFLEWNEGQMMFLDGEASSLQLVPVRLDVSTLLADAEEATPTQAALPASDPDTEAVAEVEPKPEVRADTEAVADEVAFDADETMPARMLFVASRSKRSTKFHRVECTAAGKIAASKRLEFATADEALSEGLEPCKKCIG